MPLAMASQIINLCSPIPAQQTFCDVSMQRGMWPIHCATYPPVLHRVVVNVIDVPREVRIVADLMLPIAPLPDTALPLCHTSWSTVFVGADPAREAGFDQCPARRVIRISERQTPDGVQMLRQHHHRYQ